MNNEQEHPDLCTGIYESKRGYQPRNNLVKDDTDLLADSHNVHNVGDFRQTEICKGESPVPGPHHLEGETVTAKSEVFTAVTMKNVVFWVVTPCGSCKNRCFGGT
jgi:hypothetical protein